MCGLVGYIGHHTSSAQVEKMLLSQQHRGPDHTQTYIDEGFAGLGHNRLSIIDLSPQAHQPFVDTSGRYVLVFNGEIYNYKELKNQLKVDYQFTTSSDTEVLMAAYVKYGKDCLTHLNGMFAFAVWDTKEKQLFAARDRFGVKPLYYSKFNEGLYFASEIKAFRAAGIPLNFDTSVCASYFAFGSYGLPNQSFYQGIHQLPAGHFLSYHSSKLSIHRWYNFEQRIAQQPTYSSFECLKKDYLNLLKESISLRFRADVPVGINLSGGVDSSLLLALVNQREDARAIQAFTFYTGDERYDELPWVEAMLAHSQTPLNAVQITVPEVVSFAEKISQTQDEPYGGIPTLAYAKLFFTAAQNGVKVLLDGQGMDEQWAGYDYYHQASEHTIQGLDKSVEVFKKHCLHPDFLSQASKPKYPNPFKDAVQNKQYRDLFYTKIPRALRFNDRVSMAFSTELREPFLDYRLVEMAFAQPLNYKIQHGHSKYLLRELLRDFAGMQHSFAPKRPLQTPQREWLANELEAWVTQRLEQLFYSKQDLWFNKDAIFKAWKDYQAGAQTTSFHLWQWVNFSMLADY